jgi:hypothetical protein
MQGVRRAQTLLLASGPTTTDGRVELSCTKGTSMEGEKEQEWGAGNGGGRAEELDAEFGITQ